MRFELEAVTDINRQMGNRLFKHLSGETVELSAEGVEIALSDEMDGAYKLVRSIPDTPTEKAAAKAEADAAKAAAKAEADKAALMGEKKDKLVKKAEKSGIENADQLNKEPLVDAILSNQTDSKGDK